MGREGDRARVIKGREMSNRTCAPAIQYMLSQLHIPATHNECTVARDPKCHSKREEGKNDMGEKMKLITTEIRTPAVEHMLYKTPYRGEEGERGKKKRTD